MARSKKSKAKENAVVKPEDCESLKKSRLVFVSDEEVEAMQDVSEQKKNTKKKTQSSTDEETDDALTVGPS